MIKKLSDTLMLRKWFNSEQQNKSAIKVAIIGGIAVALFAMFGSWAVWTTTQGFKAKDNEQEIIELKDEVNNLEQEFKRFEKEILDKIVWVE